MYENFQFDMKPCLTDDSVLAAQQNMFITFGRDPLSELYARSK